MAAPTTAGLTFPTIGATGIPNLSTAPSSTYQYLDAKRNNLIQSARQRPLVRLWDENHFYIGNIAQEVKVEAAEEMSDSGPANILIRKDNWLSNFILYDRRAEQDLHITIDPVPTQRSWRPAGAARSRRSTPSATSRAYTRSSCKRYTTANI